MNQSPNRLENLIGDAQGKGLQEKDVYKSDNPFFLGRHFLFHWTTFSVSRFIVFLHMSIKYTF